MTSKIPTDIYSRVSGYYRPTRQWNRGKKEEFDERKNLKFEEEVLHEKSLAYFHSGDDSLHHNSIINGL